MSVKTIAPEKLVPDVHESAPVGRTPVAPAGKRGQTVNVVTRRILLIVPPLLLGAFILVSWYLATTIRHDRSLSLILPAPGDVFATLSDGIASGLFLSNALVTIQESLVGFLLAILIALPMGYGIAKSRLFAITMQPYLAAGQAIPAIVIAPVLYLVFGYGAVPIIILCTLIMLFPMVITTALGFQTMDRALIDAARVEGASGWSLLAHIEFPLALPAILAALRTGLTLSITGALVGEFVSQGSQGLGALVLVATDQFNAPLLYATLIVLGGLAALYYSASWLLVKLAEVIY